MKKSLRQIKASEFLSPEEYCQLMRISRPAVYRQLTTGEIRAVKCGKLWRIPNPLMQDAEVRKRVLDELEPIGKALNDLYQQLNSLNYKEA